MFLQASSDEDTCVKSAKRHIISVINVGSRKGSGQRVGSSGSKLSGSVAKMELIEEYSQIPSVA